MQWSKMHSRRLELNITLLELKNFDCPDDDQPAATRRLEEGTVAPADTTATDQGTATTPDATSAPTSSAAEPTEEGAESEGTGQYGKVMVIAAYKPQYWVYETNRTHETVDVEELGDPVQMSFKNTDTILVLAITPGFYRIDYRVIREEPIPVNNEEFFYSQYITLGCGFTLMFLALIKFHGMDFVNWIKKKVAKKSKSQADHQELESNENGESLDRSQDDYDAVPNGSIVADDNAENTGFGGKEQVKKVKKA